MESHFVLLSRVLADRHHLVLIALLNGPLGDEHLPAIARLKEKLARGGCLEEHALLHSTCFFAKVIGRVLVNFRSTIVMSITS